MEEEKKETVKIFEKLGHAFLYFGPVNSNKVQHVFPRHALHLTIFLWCNVLRHGYFTLSRSNTLFYVFGDSLTVMGSSNMKYLGSSIFVAHAAIASTFTLYLMRNHQELICNVVKPIALVTRDRVNNNNYVTPEIRHRCLETIEFSTKLTLVCVATFTIGQIVQSVQLSVLSWGLSWTLPYMFAWSMLSSCALVVSFAMLMTSATYMSVTCEYYNGQIDHIEKELFAMDLTNNANDPKPLLENYRNLRAEIHYINHFWKYVSYVTQHVNNYHNIRCRLLGGRCMG